MIEFIWNPNKSLGDEKRLDSKSPKKRTPLGRLPNWGPKLYDKNAHSKSKIKNVNRYLEHQELRLIKYRDQKYYWKVIILWCLLLKSSKSYQFVLFNKVRKDWYWSLSEGVAKKLLKECMNKARKWNLFLTLRRFYIDKPNGKKRPIGAPTVQSAFISKAFNDMIYFCFEKDFSNFQHGFRPERGVHTALFEVWARLTLGKCRIIYEFDFQSFFNNVKMEWVNAILYPKAKILADLIQQVFDKIHYKFDFKFKHPIELPWEKEFKLGYTFNYPGMKPMMRRTGLPQGLSISPVLATLALELLNPPKGLVMYADDGLVMGQTVERDDLIAWLEKLRTMGIEIEPKKSGWVGNEFKFLGVDFNISEKVMNYKGSKLCWKGADITDKDNIQIVYDWLKNVAQYYGKEASPWSWDIRPDSVATEFRIKGWSWKNLWTIIMGLWAAEAVGSRRYFLFKGIYEIPSLSSQSCEYMLDHIKGIKLAKLKYFDFIDKQYHDVHPKNKGKYREAKNFIDVRQMISNDLVQTIKEIHKKWYNF